jgi:predicted transcriptional regulator
VATLISDVHTALQKASEGPVEPAAPPQEPAVPVRASIKPDYIVCLEDGKKFKSLKRHLRGEHGMTPAEYRDKWGLRSDYPMVAPNYSAARSSLARTMGLGRKASAAETTEGSESTAEKSRPAARRRTIRSKAKAR